MLYKVVTWQWLPLAGAVANEDKIEVKQPMEFQDRKYIVFQAFDFHKFFFCYFVPTMIVLGNSKLIQNEYNFINM